MGLKARTLSNIGAVGAAAWNALAGDHPFLRHEFLAALEDSGSARPDTGWQPRHLLLEDKTGLAAVAPLYAKSHSWGEFVFDFAWARAWESRGLAYYPKLLLAIPFTPASGPRWLIRPDLPRAQTSARVLQAVDELMHAEGYSSAHALFLDEQCRGEAGAAGWLGRQDCHFQWINHDFADFEAYIATFTAEKRKKTRRERRRVVEQGIEFRTLTGHELDGPLLNTLYEFHASTFLQHGHTPYLNVEFFAAVARQMPDALMVKLALHGATPVAAAVFFRNHDTLWGRYWGAAADFHSLHFEACYYQGIDYCIEQGLQRFEPGTQGEHKLARGFAPTLTSSSHLLADPALRAAVANYLRREAVAIKAYAAQAAQHLPFNARHLAGPDFAC
ncbi:MAG: GNAT family N-acetyltransferase [Steroidobacteraceae bacterium]